MQPEDTSRIPIYRFGRLAGYALIDPSDFDDLNQWLWRIALSRRTRYAVRKTNGSRIFMHNQVLAAPIGMEVDHINRNGLDNRRDNLRIVTHAQNRQNTPSYRRATSKTGITSPFRGVYWDKYRHLWVAQVMLNKRRVFGGRFATEQAAAEAAKAARAQHLPYAVD